MFLTGAERRRFLRFKLRQLHPTDTQVNYIADRIREEEAKASDLDQLPIDLDQVIMDAIDEINEGALDYANV